MHCDGGARGPAGQSHTASAAWVMRLWRCDPQGCFHSDIVAKGWELLMPGTTAMVAEARAAQLGSQALEHALCSGMVPVSHFAFHLSTCSPSPGALFAAEPCQSGLGSWGRAQELALR